VLRLLLPALLAGQGASTPPLRVAVDSARRTITITTVAFDVPVARASADGMTMAMEMRHSEVAAGRLAWPVTRLLGSVTLELEDAAGRTLPRALLHHLNLVNFDRRQLIYPLAERFIGFGQETEDVALPQTLGLPLEAGQQVGVFLMWDNRTGEPIRGVRVRLTFHWMAPNQEPPPIRVLPLIVDARLVAGGVDTFTVPPGGRVVMYDFSLPTSGHLVAATGHLHDHGLWLRLDDLTRGKEVTTVTTIRDSTGHVLRMSRKLLALRGEGPHLLASHRYRLSAAYENPTTVPMSGMMGLFYGVFAPDRMDAWPRIDSTDQDYLRDLADLDASPSGDWH
jgi:hypothetical protein